jgi:PTS system mannose-specific IIA component
MIGVVIVSHGGLAEELRLACEHVVGPQDRMVAIPIHVDDDMEGRRVAIVEACAACDDGSGVVILTDMFGGTPSNLAISVMKPRQIEVIAGANLPMLVKLAEVRNRKPLAETVVAAQEAGRKYISVASAFLNAGEP